MYIKEIRKIDGEQKGVTTLIISLASLGLLTIGSITLLHSFSDKYGYTKILVLIRLLIPLISIGALVYVLFTAKGAFM